MSDVETAVTTASESLRHRLVQTLGPDNVLAEEYDRAFYSTDLSWRETEVADLVVELWCHRRIGHALDAAPPHNTAGAAGVAAEATTSPHTVGRFGRGIA